MKTKALPVKGLRTPKLFVFASGFIDGRIRKTAVIDPETGHMVSAYVAEKIFLFNQACRDRVILLNRELASLHTEAASLLMDLEGKCINQGEPLYNLTSAEASLPDRSSHFYSTAAEAQAARAASISASRIKQEQDRAEETRKAEAEKERAARVRLSEIRESIINKELNAEESFSVTAEALKGLICTYAHGASRTPVSIKAVPELPYRQHLSEYYEAYRELEQSISMALSRKE